MGIAGSRFDPEVMRREAEEARERAKRKKIQSLIVNVCVLIGLGIAALVGWNYWKNYSEEKERQQQEQQAREEKAKADAAREQAAREKAEREKREAELAKQKAEREKREAERQRLIREREETRLRQQQEQIRLQHEREELRLKEEKARVETAQRKIFIEKALADLPLEPEDHVVMRAGFENRLSLSVSDKLWDKLREAQKERAVLDFFELARGTTVTNEFNAQCYPDRETFARMQKYLATRTFQLAIRPRERLADLQGITLVAADPKKGLAFPAKARELKNGSGRCTGWTVPFVLGAETDLFLMEQTAVSGFVRDWRKLSSRLKPEEIESTLAEFVKSVRSEMAHPLPIEQSESKETKRETKPKASFKGGSDIHSFGSRSW